MLAANDVVHLQNIMNPTAMAMAVECGHAVVTVQDHRVFCPGQGRTLSDGRPCTVAMTDKACRACVPDDAYRRSTLTLTRRRLDALRGAEIVVLSRYMAEQLDGGGGDAGESHPAVGRNRPGSDRSGIDLRPRRAAGGPQGNPGRLESVGPGRSTAATGGCGVGAPGVGASPGPIFRAGSNRRTFVPRCGARAG